MTLNADDPALTAYALDELEAEDRQSVAHALHDAPALQEEVAAIRALGDQLADELSHEPAPALSGEQRAALIAPVPQAAWTMPFMTRPVWGSLLAAAAVLALAIGGFVWLPEPQGQAPRGASVNPPPADADTTIIAEAEPRIAQPDPTTTARIRAEEAARRRHEVLRVAATARGRGRHMSGHGMMSVSSHSRLVPIEDDVDPQLLQHEGPDNPFQRVSDHPLSTFAVDVATASYTNVQRILANGALPSRDEVRIEELINAFKYDYAPPASGQPFAAHLETGVCPWNMGHRIVHVGIQGAASDGDTLTPIARDVSVEIEFNPRQIAAYRLIGYENAGLITKSLDADTGTLHAGHQITALYELVPRGSRVSARIPPVHDLRYQRPASLSDAADTAEWLTVKIRYRQPDQNRRAKLEFPLVARDTRAPQHSTDFEFACAVASYGMLLRDSPYKGTSSYDTVISLASSSLDDDTATDRRAFVDLVRTTQAVSGR